MLLPVPGLRGLRVSFVPVIVRARVQWKAVDHCTFHVEADESRVNRAIGELYAALVGQNLVFAERFERGIFSSESQQRLRQLALGLCAIGAALSCYILVVVPRWCATFGFGLICFSLFGILGLIFFRIQDTQIWLKSKSRRWVGKRLRKYADKTLAPMRDASPVEIEYTLDDGQVSGQWLRNGRPDRHWMRELDRFAYVGENVCAIFAKKTAAYPKVVIVHSDRASVEAILEARAVEVSPLPTELPDDYGPATT